MQYAQGEGDGPDADDLHLDMSGALDSKWNNAACTILVAKLQAMQVERRLPERSNEYLENLVEDRFKRLFPVWKGAQTQQTATGKWETPEDVERRMVKKKEQQLRNARHSTRCRSVSNTVLFNGANC